MQRNHAERNASLREKLIRHYTPVDGAENVFKRIVSNTAREHDPLLRWAPIDQIHIGGLHSTRQLAEKALITKNTRVLDIGAGTGGAARFLHKHHGCPVISLDITMDYCRLGLLIDHKTRNGRHPFINADSNDLPFLPNVFDLVWMQHVSMNIIDKYRLFYEARRVLRSGGCLLMHELCIGTGGRTYFPVPWATDQEMSFMVPESEMRTIIKSAGFSIDTWEDVSLLSLKWYRKRLTRLRQNNAADRTASLFGSSFVSMAENVVRNLSEETICVFQAVLY